ncbi:MBL fold metallo-hydrolase [Cytobacillus sp. Hz8]|uniref:MBL fold metallo-hydrolase n=1 Tax=Cytobacillus sp. Hz8 TaxID=3347168 RepID=UPI0035DB8E6A
MQITKNIYQVLGGMYANIANIYVIKAKESIIIIDAAETTTDWKIVEETLALWGLDKYPISNVLLTHKHQGHIGNAKYLRDNGAVIIAHEDDADAIENGDLDAIVDFSPFPEREEYIPCPVDIRVKDGDKLHLDGVDVTMIHAPGHTDGSVLFQIEEEDKIVIFAGDVISVKNDCQTVNLGWEGGNDFNAQLYWETVQKLYHVECELLLPAHGQPVMQNGTKMLKMLYQEALLKWREPTIDFE